MRSSILQQRPETLEMSRTERCSVAFSVFHSNFHPQPFPTNSNLPISSAQPANHPTPSTGRHQKALPPHRKATTRHRRRPPRTHQRPPLATSRGARSSSERGHRERQGEESDGREQEEDGEGKECGRSGEGAAGENSEQDGVEGRAE